MKKMNWLLLITFVILTEVVGGLSGYLAGNSREVFLALNQPPLAPPSWVFPIGWVILYALMAIAACLAYTQSKSARNDSSPLYFYLVQLFINFSWSIVFFRWRSLWGAVVTIFLLDLAVLLTMRNFKKYSPIAQKLMFPYLIWILYATYLAIHIALIN